MNINLSVRKFVHRPTALLLPLSLALSLGTPCYASSIDDNLPDAHAIELMEVRAQQANPREQCFLYTELVHTMTELAGRQMLAGDTGLATATLRKVEHYAQLIQIGLAKDTKRLKNAQLLMHHTTVRLTDYMHAASSEDRPVLQATLKHLDKVQDDLLQQVFAH